jgi:hypothetical protein
MAQARGMPDPPEPTAIVPVQGETQLVPRSSRGVGLSGEVEGRKDWERLWLATQSRTWSSLALVPAGAEVPREMVLEVAVRLARTGITHLGVPIRIADATEVELSDLMRFRSELSEVMQDGDLVIIALGSVTGSATTVPLARSCDQAILCVPIGGVSFKDAKRAVGEIGASHFIGSVVLRPSPAHE